MLSVSQIPPAVHSNCEVYPSHAVTVTADPYLPTAGDFLYELGRDIGLDGGTTGSVVVPGSGLWTQAERLRWTVGVRAGRDEREAIELGRSLGELGSGISEPPDGFSAAERAAFRRGYAEGLDDFERGEAMAEALDWIMIGHDEAQEAMAALTDMLPPGVTD